MLAEKPDLQFVGCASLTARSLVPSSPSLSARSAKFTAVTNDDLVRIQQPRDLHRNLFPAPGRPFDSSRLGDIVCHGDAQSAEQLNALGDGVDKFRLLTEMFIEKQMELVEGRSGNLPMRFLIQVAQGHSVGKQLIEAVPSFPVALALLNPKGERELRCRIAEFHALFDG